MHRSSPDRRPRRLDVTVQIEHQDQHIAGLQNVDLGDSLEELAILAKDLPFGLPQPRPRSYVQTLRDERGAHAPSLNIIMATGPARHGGSSGVSSMVSSLVEGAGESMPRIYSRYDRYQYRGTSAHIEYRDGENYLCQPSEPVSSGPAPQIAKRHLYEARLPITSSPVLGRSQCLPQMNVRCPVPKTTWPAAQTGVPRSEGVNPKQTSREKVDGKQGLGSPAITTAAGETLATTVCEKEASAALSDPTARRTRSSMGQISRELQKRLLELLDREASSPDGKCGEADLSDKSPGHERPKRVQGTQSGGCPCREAEGHPEASAWDTDDSWEDEWDEICHFDLLP